MVQSVDLHAILPELILAGTVLVVLTVDLFLPVRFKHLAMPLSMLGVLAALAAVFTLIGEERETFSGMFVVDPFALLFKGFFLVAAAVVLAVSYRYFREGRFFQGEYYFLLLTSFLGCVLMPSSRDLLMIFLALELVSLPGFLMAALRKGDVRSTEAGMKFFIIGVLSAAVMLYGMSLIYGATGAITGRGTTRLAEIGEALAGDLGGYEALVIAAILFVVAGFAFKVSAVPFQFWAPDTYEGSPVPVAAFLSVASKAAGFAGLLQLMFVAFPNQAPAWTPIFAALSLATMTLGNLVALQQRQVVRLLSYSSIAHAGYMLLPFALVGAGAESDASAFSAAVTYILIYGVMNLGIFSVVIALSREAPRLHIQDFAGLIRRAPVVAVAVVTFMISLAGIPPTAGFWAKLFIFRAAIEAGGFGPWLAAAMVVNSVISLYYYLAIARQAAILDVEGEVTPFRSPALVTGIVGLGTLAIVVGGFYPDLFARLPQVSTLVGG